MKNKNLGASIRARLLNKAKSEGVDFQLLLTRYALERLLYRLSISTEKEHFLLKGALLFDLWYDVPLRPTRDIDLLGFGLAEIPHLLTVFKNLCELKVDDGITFDLATVKAAEIRKEANYSGTRVALLGLIEGAKCPVQIDIGYGEQSNERLLRPMDHIKGFPIRPFNPCTSGAGHITSPWNSQASGHTAGT